jgi:hypothetical protein
MNIIFYSCHGTDDVLPLFYDVIMFEVILVTIRNKSRIPVLSLLKIILTNKQKNAAFH